MRFIEVYLGIKNYLKNNTLFISLRDMKEILEKTGWDKKKPPRYNIPDCRHIFSLADLLANKSWCQIVWTEEWIKNSLKALNLLQLYGEKECIKYIKETML